VTPQFGASLTVRNYAPRVINCANRVLNYIHSTGATQYDCHMMNKIDHIMFIIQLISLVSVLFNFFLVLLMSHQRSIAVTTFRIITFSKLAFRITPMDIILTLNTYCCYARCDFLMLC
jgi:hypothetical protein